MYAENFLYNVALVQKTPEVQETGMYKAARCGSDCGHSVWL